MKIKPAKWISCLLAVSMLLTALAWAAPAEELPDPPQVTAASAVVMDYETGELLYAKDADTMRVPASMTKVMTAYLVFEELEAGRLSLDSLCTVSAENARMSRNGEYPSVVPLEAGSRLTVDTLLRLLFVPSASAACRVLAETVSGSEDAFVQRMNETAARLGMQTAYENCHGAKPHYITARSQAILIREFIQRFPQVLEYTTLTSTTFNGVTYENTNKLLEGTYYYEGIDGFKTGTIPEAGYCLSATAVRNGQRLITVVMASSSADTRCTDSIRLLDYGWEALEALRVFDDMNGHWGLDAAEALYSLGAELHVENALFRPDEAITRAEFAAMLYTTLEASNALPQPAEEPPAEKPVFSDLAGHWAREYIEAAAAAGLVSGRTDGVFDPEGLMTREQAMVLLDRAWDLPEENGLGFADDGRISLYALEAAARTTAAGLFQGNEAGRLDPLGIVTRAQGAELICRLLEL